MANLTSAINVQIDSETKKQATSILNELGLSMSTAINLFLKQVIKRDGLPFEVINSKPNYDIYNYFTKEELEETVKELEYIKSHLNEYKENNKWEDLKAELSNEKSSEILNK